MKLDSSKIDYAVIIMMLLSSGSAYFYMLKPSITILLFFFVAFSKWILTSNYVIKYNSFSIVYLLLIVLGSYRHGFNIFYLTHCLYLVGTMLAFSTISFEDFRKKYLNVVFILSLFSLIVYLLFLFNIITPNLIQGVTDGYYIFLFNNFGHSQFGIHDRMCSIFWEPGIYQIVLNIAILFNINLFKNSSIKDRDFRKLLLILCCLFLTRSTAGYLTFALIVFFIFRDYFSRFKYLYLLFPTVSFFFLYILLSSSVITDKFDESNVSFIIRFGDILSLLKIICLYPVFGVGVSSSLFIELSTKFRSVANSNGLLLQISQYGLIWLVAYISSVMYNLRHMKIGIPIVFSFVIILLLNFGEPLSYTPLLLLFTQKFKNYG